MRRPKFTILDLTPAQAKIVEPLLKKVQRAYRQTLKGPGDHRILIGAQLHSADDLAYGSGPRRKPFLRMRALSHNEMVAYQEHVLRLRRENKPLEEQP